MAGGRPFGSHKEKAFTDALRLAVNRNDEEGKKKLNRIAEKLVSCAIEGESWAIQQVADRLDGKPAQESMVTVDDKRDATDWTSTELDAIINDARKSGNGAQAPAARNSKLN
jgi:hypothetical protein